MKNILLMDDDSTIRIVMSKLIESRGYVVNACASGGEAIDLYNKFAKTNDSFDAVILDYMVLDGLGGKETMIELKKINPNIVGILATGNTESDEALKYKEYGFSDMISKPYTLEELDTMLSQYI